MVPVVGRQQLLIPAVETHAIEVDEVRIAPLFLADSQEINDARLLVHFDDLGNVALAAGDLVLELVDAA